MRINQSRLVVGLVAGAAVLVAAVAAFRSATMHRQIMVKALEGGLERIYDRSVLKATWSAAQQATLLPMDSLRRLLLDAGERESLLPSFINVQDIYLAQDSVEVPSKALICVVRLDDAHFYGITGQRVVRLVTRDELTSWGSFSIATNTAKTTR